MVNKEFMRMAGLVHRAGEKRRLTVPRNLLTNLDLALQEVTPLRALRRCLSTALAGKSSVDGGDREAARGAIRRMFESLREAFDDAERLSAGKLTEGASLRDIYLDIEQVEVEFGNIECDLKEKTLSVVTDYITLENVDLGPFQICLDVEGLNTSGGRTYRVIAVDPHGAGENDTIVHPHVSGDKMCEGEAKTPIRSALDNGRLLDFFMLVRSVLMTYAEGSAYVELENWNSETPCSECGRHLSDDDASSCTDCGNAVCEGCRSDCSVCGGTLCGGCGLPCQECDALLCSDCHVSCPNCGKRLCPECLDGGKCSCNQTEEEEDEPETQSEVEVVPERPPVVTAPVLDTYIFADGQGTLHQVG